MNLFEVRALILAQPGADETQPFGPDVFVYKVMGKMYALLPVQEPTGSQPYVVTKAEPHFGQLLRDTYAAITPAWHFNKRHWVSTLLDGSVPDEEMQNIVEHSYRLVVQGLTRAQRAELETRFASPE